MCFNISFCKIKIVNKIVLMIFYTLNVQHMFKYVNHMLNTRVFTYVKGIKNILFVSLLFFYTLGLMNILYILILNKKKIINTYTNQVQITFNFIQFHDKINLYFLSLFCISLSEQKTIKNIFVILNS